MSNINNTAQPFYALCSLPFSFPSRISSLACLDLNDTEYPGGKMTGDERSKEGKKGYGTFIMPICTECQYLFLRT